MRFGLFHLLQWHESRTQEQVYREAIEQILRAEELGFDSVWLAEHHFSRYGLCPSILNFGSYLAARTRRIRIGLAVLILPFYNPLLLAEEAALTDLLSGGRLDFGVGRGYQWSEYLALGLSMEESRDRFREAVDIILEAWKGERFSYHGKYYQVSNVAVHPQPIQKPHPPIWLAAVSPPTAELAGREGFNVLFAQTQSFKNLKEIYDLYMQHWTAAGRDPARAQIRVARSVYVSETDAEARREMSLAYDWFLKAQQAVTTPPDGNWELIPESYRHYRENFPKLGRLTYDFIWEQVGLHGPPGRVRERIAMLQSLVNLDYLICWMSMGGLDHAKAMASMERFARDVMPHFTGG